MDQEPLGIPVPPILKPVQKTDQPQPQVTKAPARHNLALGLVIGAIVLVIGGTAFAVSRGYFQVPFLSKKAVTNTANTNTSANSNTNVSPTALASAPAPLAQWNAEYQPLSTQFKTTPTSLAAGQAVCDGLVVNGTVDPERNTCYADLALGFRAASLCEKITDPHSAIALDSYEDEVALCYRDFATTYAVFDCASVASQPYRDICYNQFAWRVEQGATLDCSKIESGTIKSDCQGQVELQSKVQQSSESLLAMQYATCYINKHPEVLQAMPQNEITASYNDYVTADPKDLDCDTLDAAKIENAKASLITDADGDGLTVISEDFFETSDAKADTDGNGVNDLQEALKEPSTTPTSTTDSDGDNLPDAIETSNYHTDIHKADTDGDGLSDYEEVSGYITNPLKADSDGDGFLDGSEICHSYNPLGTGTYSSPLLYPPAACPPQLTPTNTSRPNATKKTTMTIDGLTATAKSGTVTVTWTTKQGAYAALYFGPTSAYDTGRYPDSLGYETNHTVTFSGTAGQTYHYAVLSCPKDILTLSDCAVSTDQTVVVK